MSLFEQKPRFSIKNDYDRAYLSIFYVYLGILPIAYCLLDPWMVSFGCIEIPEASGA